VTGEGALAVAASLALFAAALVPGVPLGPAELLMTPLLPELKASLPASSGFLQPEAVVKSPRIAATNSTVLKFSFMTNLRLEEHVGTPTSGAARTVSGRSATDGSSGNDSTPSENNFVQCGRIRLLLKVPATAAGTSHAR
jgi:hypothetical protein